MDSDRLNLLLFLHNPFVKHCPSGKLGQVYTWWHNTYVEAAVPSVPRLPWPLFLFLLRAFDRIPTLNHSYFPSCTDPSEQDHDSIFKLQASYIQPTTMPTTRSAARLPPPVAEDNDIPKPNEATPSVSGPPDHDEESEPSGTNDDDKLNDPPTPRPDRDLTPARLLREIINANKRPEMVKPRDPDTFDSSDAKKLKSFLVQCQLNFLDRPQVFRSDSRKINYVLSYLRGFALEW